MPKKPEYDIMEQSKEEIAHQQLLENPKYAVHVHDRQIKRITELLEQLASRIVSLEDKLIDLDLNVRFNKTPSPDGPPEPPSGTDYGRTT